MPDVIHIGTFEERLGSYWRDIFAITAVLAVGVGPYFYGFSMEKQLFRPVSCACLTKWNFKIITDLDMKNRLTVSSDSTYSVKAVDPRNKKKKKKERRIRWRNGHILQSIKNHKTCAFHLNS